MRCPQCRQETAKETQVCVCCGAPVRTGRGAVTPTDSSAGKAPGQPPQVRSRRRSRLSLSGTDSVSPFSPVSVKKQPSIPVPGSEVDGAAFAGWVGAMRFSTTRLRPGYDVEQVDGFLEAIYDTFLGVREPPLTSDEIRDKKFLTTRLRPGYDEQEVDTFLNEAESRLRVRGARSEGTGRLRHSVLYPAREASSAGSAMLAVTEARARLMCELPSLRSGHRARTFTT